MRLSSSPTNNFEMMSRPPSQHRSRIIAFAASLIVGIALIEILFRSVIFPEWKAVSFSSFEKHPIYGTFQKPNLRARRYNPPNYDVINTTNSLGFRDREEGFAEDLAGVWLAGASNSYGGFVEDNETLAARLQFLGYKAANLSSEGHTWSKQARVIRHLAAEGYRPRAVIVEMTLNNVLGDYRQAIKDLSLPVFGKPKNKTISPDASDMFVAKIKSLRRVTEVGRISLKARLIKNSAFYCWLKIGINSIPALRRLTLEWGLRADVALADSAPPDLMEDIPGNPNEARIGSTADFAAALQSWVATNLKVPFAIALIPSHHHLNPQRFKRYAEYLGKKPETLDPTRTHRKLLSALKARGVEVMDMEPVLSASDKFLSFPDDGHINAVAHDLIANEMAVQIRKRLGLEPKP